MCGIAGMILAEQTRTEKELESIRTDFSTLIAATQSRGRDATGAFVVNRSGVKFLKMALTASKMVKTPDWWALMDAIGDDTIAVIGHTRAATQGSPSVKGNNHPIEIGRIIGVHNGIIINDEEIRESCPWDAEIEVDSAAIFALLNSTPKPLTTETIGESLEDLVGDFAIVALDMRRPNSVFIARDDGRPLFYGRDASLGVLWLSSTERLMATVFDGIATSLPAYTVARLTRKHAAGKSIKVEGFGGSIEDLEDSYARQPMWRGTLEDLTEAEQQEMWDWSAGLELGPRV